MAKQQLPSHDLGVLRQLFTFLRPCRSAVLGAMLALLIAAAAVLCFGIVLQRVVDQGLSSGSGEPLALSTEPAQCAQTAVYRNDLPGHPGRLIGQEETGYRGEGLLQSSANFAAGADDQVVFHVQLPCWQISKRIPIICFKIVYLIVHFALNGALPAE